MLGILYAIGALIFRGFGDFYIQKSVRKIGNLDSLFFITVFGSLVLAPFALSHMTNIAFRPADWIFLGSIGVFGIIAALVNFEALRQGKLSVVEPIITIEIPTSIILARTFLSQQLDRTQVIIIVCLIVGIVLIMYKREQHSKKNIEKGIFRGVLTGVLAGGANFFVGYGATTIDPRVTLWCTYLIMSLIMFAVILISRRMRQVIIDIKCNMKTLLITAFFDNFARLFYSLATTLLPIGVVLGMSEGYVVFAALLGLKYNKEKLSQQQKVGLLIAGLSAIVLASLTVS